MTSARFAVALAAICTVNTVLAAVAADWHAVTGWLAATCTCLVLAHERAAS